VYSTGRQPASLQHTLHSGAARYCTSQDLWPFGTPAFHNLIHSSPFVGGVTGFRVVYHQIVCPSAHTSAATGGTKLLQSTAYATVLRCLPLSSPHFTVGLPVCHVCVRDRHRAESASRGSGIEHQRAGCVQRVAGTISISSSVGQRW